MNIENLTQDEVVQLQRLLGKLNPTPQVEVDPLTTMVDDILDEFDFEKVREVMVALDWKWASAEADIPSMSKLKDTARHLLISVYNLRKDKYTITHPEVPVQVETGGFKATALANEDSGEVDFLKLEFIVTEWEAGV
jgi:hypothetical protein